MLKNNKIIALIPARGLSKSIKKKNLLKIKNKKLIQRINFALKKSKYIDKIICSSEDKQIIDHCKKNDIEFIKRPRHLSGDNSDIFFTARHCISYLEKKNLNYDIIILAQPTSPFVTTNIVNKLIKFLINNKNYNSSQTVHFTPHNYHYLNTRVMLKNNEVEFKFKKERKSKTNKQKKPTTYAFGNLIACKVKKLLEKKDFFCKPSGGLIINRFSSFDLDDKEDLLTIGKYK